MSDNIEDLYPLSPLQGGMLFHAISEPGKGLYFNQLVCELRGALDVEAFAAAWRGVVAAHPVLRTALVWDDVDEPVQVVLREVDLPLREEDWRDLSPEGFEARLETFLAKDRQEGFDLSQAPLIRLTLLRAADRVYRFVFSHSHLVLDGWSVPLVVKDFFTLYEGTVAGRAPRLAPPRPFGDYLGWLAEHDLKTSEDFWRRELAGFHEPTPTGAGVGEGEGRATLIRHLSEQTTAALNAFTRRHGVTLSTVVQAAWALVLGRLSGSEDVVFGTTVSGRPPDLAGVEEMVGLFINTQPVRVRWSGDLTWATWLRRIQEQQVDARQHEHAPLVKVQRWSEVPAGTALFDTLVVFENYPLDSALTSASRALEVHRVQSKEEDHFGLTLTSSPEARLPLHFRYDRSRFTREFAQAQLDRMVLVMETLATRPESRLGELSLVSAAERELLLVRWNDTDRELPWEGALHERFEEQAARTPEALAVLDDETSLTFRQLDRRANRLAHWLRARGVGPESRVALCLERGVDMVVALFGVLKSGGAYVPLDPAHPPERLGFVVQDAGATFVLSQRSLAKRPRSQGTEVICLDDPGMVEALAAEPDTAPPRVSLPAHLAYIIYTSGSTGQPKGVMIQHASVMNLRAALASKVFAGLSGPLRFSLNSPLAFDMSVQQLVHISDGHALCVVSQTVRQDAALLVEWVERHRVDVFDGTPSHLRVLLDEGLGAHRPLRILFGGEATDETLWARIAAHPHITAVNVYGPTECTVEATVRFVRGTSGPSLGPPLANVRAYVLDANLQLAPVGVAGELFIAGEGVGRGYLGRPALTAERFLPNPFSTVPGDRMYRTGDKVHWLPNGELRFLGRIDFQVKLRGFRIELGEIEATLCRHPEVRDALVLLREDAGAAPRLVAYVVSSGERGREPAVLREFLLEQLPEYMVPAAFVAMDELPRTSSGKVDRRNLPAPEISVVERTDEVAPRDAKEETLAAIWAQVLGRPRVSVHDDFFELGGDSILGIQVISRAAQAGLHLRAKQLFENPTVARLAAVVSEAPREVIAQGPVTGPVALTPIQHGFFEHERSGVHHFNQALRLTLRERMVPEHLGRALQLVREHHDALRLRFTKDAEGRWQQELLGLDGVLPLETVDLSKSQAREAELVAHAARVQASLTLSTGEVARAVLFESGPDVPQELLIVIHHLAVDAVSWRVLVEDLLSSYQRLRADEPVKLPAKTVSYQSWASRLVEHARTPAAQAEATFWLGLPWERVGALPREVEGGPANTEGASKVVEVALEPAETQLLLQDVAKALRAKPDELLLAALAHVLRRWTGASCVRVDMEGHGRENVFGEVDLSRTVGWFTSMFPVLVEATGEGPGAWVRAAKEAMRRIPSKGVGFGVLRYLSPDPALRERLRALPAPEVGFNYLGQFDNVLPATAPLRMSEGSVGPTRAPEGMREHLLDVDCIVSGGRMRLMFTHGPGIHRTGTVETLARGLSSALRELIAHATSEDPRGLSPSDFPLAKLGQGALEGLADRMASKGLRLRDVEDLYPLSPLQQGILFHILQDEASQPYFNQMAFELEGALDVKALTEAWRQAARRFSILRTAFYWDGLDAPLQAVMRDVEPPVQVEDWRAVPRGEVEARVSAFLEEDRRRGVELSVAPLFRLGLLRTDERVWRVVFSFSHLLLDGWSTQLVTQDVFTRYEALRRGVTPPRGEVRPYRDFIAWLERQDPRAAKEFWSKALVGYSEPTRVDVAAAARGLSGRGGQELRLGAEETAALVAFARQQGITQSTLVQGAWAVVLGRYSGRDDVVFGATVAGRPAELTDFESMVGLFINSIPVRVRMPSEARVGTWLRELQGWMQEARQYESTPLVDVRRWSEVPSGEPLFETLFTYENYPMEAGLSTPSEDLVVRNPMAVEADHHPISLVVMPGNEWVLKLNHDAARFDALAVRRMLEQVRHLLSELRGKVEQPLSTLDLMGADERRRLLEEWSGRSGLASPGQTLHERFEAQVARTPEALAVLDDETSLTFSQLDHRANRLARWLRARGVGPESRVALCLERGVDMVVAVLGVLKSGGAYVPLDPAHPRERLAFVLQDARAAFVLTQRALAERVEAQGVEVIPLDEPDMVEALASESESAPPRVSLPEHLAYVIYTSGSTGQPKGVMIQHASVMSLRAALASTALVGLNGPLRFSVSAPLAFDASVQQLVQISDGHTLCVVPQAARQDAALLVSWIERHGVDVLDCAPSHLRLLLGEGLASRRELRVLVGGEAVDEALWEQLSLHPRITAFNVYGPTECTVDSTVRAVRGAARPSLGAPLANVRAYVLDANLQPVAVGVPGELFLAGEGVGRGYLERPALTAERFVPNPFSTVPGARMYRTGDKARWLPDGELAFLGRLDFQVKLRGFRIELGEIESVLRAHPSVGDAVAVVRDEGSAGAKLVAYVVPSREQPDPTELRAHLVGRLPEYMVPSALTVLEALPLTPSGKVNRKALPAVELGAAAGVDFVAPGTATEQLLAGIFAEVLGLERVGIHSHFFELGGHSLLATRAISRIRSAFNLEVPLRELFVSPTVASLAVRVDRLIRAGASLAVPPLKPREDKGQPARLSFAQQRLWFLDQLEPGSASYNMPGAVRMSGPLDTEALARTFQELVRRHEALRTTFRSENGVAVQRVSAEVEVPLRVVQLDGLPESAREAEARRHVEQEVLLPFDLSRGPLLRATLVRLSEEEHVLVVVLHHIVSDGWSTGLLVREVAALYGAYAEGKPSPLGELPVQYGDYAEWQRGWLRGEVLEQQVEYWRKQLEGAPKALELVTDKPRPAAQSFRGAVLERRWEKGLWRKVEEVSRREGVTPFMVLLSAYQVVLARHAGQREVVVGFPIAGRTHAETEGLIGYFANTLVLRGRVEEGETFGELVGRAKEVTLGAYAHQDVPFEKLVEELLPQRDLSRSPLFQVSLTLQNTPGEEVKLGKGLVLKGLETDTKTSKFDLSLSVGEDADGVVVALNYNSDLFEEGTAERLVRHVRRVLEGGVEGWGKKVRELSLETAAERQRVVVEWSGRKHVSGTKSREHGQLPHAMTSAALSDVQSMAAWNDRGGSPPSTGEQTLAALFEATVAAGPDAVAVVDSAGESLTYGQLNERANQLAHHLRGVGVGPEVRVGLSVERSLEWVVAVLGVVKAGGAYVPLEGSNPAERMRWMKREAGVAVVVGREELVEEVAESTDVVVSLDADAALIGRQPKSNPPLRGDGRSLAYVMYTSGSTGTPKGVGVPQKAVARLVKGATYASFSAEEVWLQLAPVGFDASTLEVWGALLNGAKLVVYPAKELALEEVAATLKAHQVTSLWLTAALFEQMQAYQPEALAGVKQVLAGGDVLPVQRVKERLRAGGTLINGYGPTENTTFTTTWRMQKESDVGERGVPIGRPVEGTEVYVLDEGLRPVAVGVPGELYAGGEGLARGYVGRPELTAERFVPSPFGEGERLYRTGDVVRWKDDGALEFLGRRDGQVKVRGYRIELGEVEEGLKAVAGVREAVAMVREERGDKRLVGYVVGEVEGASVKEGMRRRLPEYLVPTVVVVLEALPLTANGKVDRRALPAPEAVTSPEDVYEAPREGLEAKLAEVFSEVLGAKRVGRKDDFFELGGHSLLATQVVARVRALTGIDLPLRTLFEAPTIEALARRLDSSRGDSTTPDVFPLVPRLPTGQPPLSFAQQRLWFFEQLSPGSAAYNVPIHLQVNGALRIDALERAFSALVARHESLRTSFALHEGEPVQVIHAPDDFQLAFEDLSALSEVDRRSAVRRRAVEESLRPFDLGQPRLLRATLLRLAPEQHVLSLVMHHIVSDGWSLGVLVRELGALYVAFSEGEQAPLPALPVQYADYALWQREWLSGTRLETQLDWWRERLAGAPPHLELPIKGPRPAVQSQRGATVPVRLPGALRDAVGALARETGTTPFMVLLSAFQVLLSRYSGQGDISVGSPIAGRRYAETEGLIGFFVNTLVLRARVQPAETFLQLLAQVRETTLGAYEHQDLPFEKLVEALRPARDLSRTALFQVLFVLQNAPVEALELPALSLVPLETEGTEAARFELSLNLSETSEGITGTLLFNSDLFSESTAARMVAHLQVLLEAITANPGQRLSALPLMTPAERQQVLGSWSTTPADFSNAAPLHVLIEQQAARTPMAPAVRYEDVLLSYAQLDARANQLAMHLRELGVGPDVPVALCLERSVELVVALLGVLKAGGAYVPLEPAQPATRLRVLVEEVAAPVVVTESRHAASFEACAAHRVLMDRDAALLAGRSAAAPAVLVAPENTAYVLFTSGSTGRPKGVAVSHGALVNYVQAATERLGLRECASFALVSTFGADLGNTVLFPALCTGGVLHVLSSERLGNPMGVAEYFQRHPVDCVKMVPAHLSAWLTAPEPARVLPRKRLVLGGESSTWALVEQVRALAPTLEVFNHYGPTETTVGVLAGPVDAVVRAATVPLGRPLAKARVYVLDAELRLVPTGVPGELFIGGEQVARGYLGRPDLTAERFGPDPFSPVSGARMYRTGDRVRWLEDGRVEFLGRADFQVKVRGFRVEPGEVAAVLREHPSVGDAVVVAREDAAGDKRLVAYVIASVLGAVDLGTLRGFLQERLPAHMVPSGFMVLEALPLTPNGKLDRRALPEPEAGALASGAVHVPPATPMEESLASIWKEVLRVERVSRHDDFFALGGHSLIATQVVARLRGSLGVEVPLRALFEAPTLEGLARKVEQVARAVSVPALRPSARQGALPLSFAQQRLWFLDKLEPGSVTYNVPSALRLEGALDVEALERAFSEVICRHENLRTSFPDEGGVPVQVISPPSRFQFRRVELHEETERESTLLRLVGEEVARPFNLSRGPLLRATLVRLSEEEHVLVVVLHHIVSDGWSTGLLVREVAALYGAYAEGKPSPLGELPVQYGDYAEWQRGWLQGEVLEQQVEYWRKQLEGAPRALELVTDRPRPAAQSFRGGFVQTQWPKELWRKVEEVSRREGVTPFMVLLSAYQVVLSRHAGQREVVVGFPIAGRTHAETEGLIGYFANTLVLRGRVEEGETFGELVGRAKEVTLGAYAHQDVPFEKLVEELLPQRDLSRSPLFQVSLTLQNTPGVEVKLGKGLVLKGLETDTKTSKFDFSLLVGEGPDGVAVVLNYNSDLFEEGTAERLVRHVRRVLEGGVEGWGKRVRELPLETEEERRRVVAWSGRGSSRAERLGAEPRENDQQEARRQHGQRPRSLHEQTLAGLFEATVAAGPDAVAVVDSAGESLTYGQLNERANQLAHHLRSVGVGPEVRVGLSVERSLEWVVAVLGVVKAGGAYVPLEGSNPAERMRWMKREAGVAVVVGREELVEEVAESADVVVSLDADAALIGRQPKSNPPLRGDGSNLAYVMYTSGSTGTPKGVGVPQKAVARLVKGATYASFSAEEVWLQLAPVGFDASTLEVWGALLNGAKLVVYPAKELALEEVAATLKAHEVTSLWLTAALFEQMQAYQPEALAGVKQVLAGGDVLPVQRVKERLRAGGTLINGYGPTENTTFTTTWRMQKESDVGERGAPIGRPVEGTEVYVLDEGLRPVAVGVPGELYAGGEGLARGYVGKPELTAERFVPSPFGEGERLYRTGDVVRWKDDGALEFLGRRDGQVKVRGYRIELGEVEEGLKQQAGVKEAVAVVREERGDKRLVGYVVGEVEGAAVKEGMRRRLPEYLVPTVVVVLEALPLTANGKVDRRALPEPEAVTSPEDVYEAPREGLEAKLAEVFSEVLGAKRVGRKDDFFELGGHSLLATQVVARVRALTGIDLPLRALFEAPSVEQLASWLEVSRGDSPARDCVTLQSEGTGTPVFFVHAVGGAVGPYRLLSRWMGAGRPVYAFQSPGLDGAEPPLEHMDALVRRYVAALRAVRPEGPYVLGGWSMGGVVAFEMARELERQGQRVEQLILLDSFASTDELLTQGPDDALLLAGMAMDLARTAGVESTLRPESLAGLSEDEQLARVIAYARESGWLPPEVQDSDLRAWRDVTRANLRVLSTFRPGAYGGPVLLLRAKDAKRERSVEPTHGWSRYVAPEQLEVEDVPGTHYTLLHAPHVQALAARIVKHVSEPFLRQDDERNEGA
ncbi:non-ribosomal peptide synthase/polyketide synthase [Myxococcus faecalis]|uniref:non-ribosomal peptide synthase/polyketide synthase n=1 Tax=Myxococcus faecalis TaxID=3115646 RepID=UPI0038D0E59B